MKCVPSLPHLNNGQFILERERCWYHAWNRGKRERNKARCSYHRKSRIQVVINFLSIKWDLLWPCCKNRSLAPFFSSWNFRNATRVARINKLKESRPEGRRKTVLVWPMWDQEGEMGLFRKVWDALTEKLGGDKSLFSVAKDLGRRIE